MLPPLGFNAMHPASTNSMAFSGRFMITRSATPIKCSLVTVLAYPSMGNTLFSTLFSLAFFLRKVIASGLASTA